MVSPIYHLKGNQRTTSGEQSRKEGGKIFGDGCRSAIAITILIKNPQAGGKHRIFFGAVDNYLSREEKLNQLKELGTITRAALTEITQDEHGDWLNLRRADFSRFIPLDGKNQESLAVFSNFSNGIQTNRDAWSYNASRKVIADNFKRCISFYNDQVKKSQKAKEQGTAFERNNDPRMLKWDHTQICSLKRGTYHAPYQAECTVTSLYRPFFKEFLYNDRDWINRCFQMPRLFPYAGAENLTINVCGVGAKEISCLMSNEISCLDSLEKTQCFPRYLYRKVDASTNSTRNLMGSLNSTVPAPEPVAPEARADDHGYIREDAIRPEAVEHFRRAYPEHRADIDADSVFYYIYGMLHSPEYRSIYANNLQKELPRIPRVADYKDFSAFEQTGRKLACLHLNYEKVPLYQGCTIKRATRKPDYKVDRLCYGKIAGKKGNAARDKSVIVYNQDITIRNIPLEVQEYVVNKKSALDWVVERCGIRQDKDSGIVNDYNDYAREIGDKKYIFNLILRVITVSLESLKLVKTLPALNLHPLDRIKLQ